jgi:hypothetical protein
MVARGLAISIALALSCVPARAAEIDVASWAKALPQNFSASGSKNEPTYLAAIDISRDGDLFTIRGGAPAWMARSVESVRVAADGTIVHRICPAGMDCRQDVHPAGFLSSAALLAAARRGLLHGMASVEQYGAYSVVCVPGEQLSINNPILDPCFEINSGAAIAEKHRTSHRFDGPSLDPVSVRIAIPSSKSAASPSSLLPKDKAS